MQYIKDLFINIRLADVFDILIVSFAFYKFFMVIRETRAEQLVKGIVMILVAAKISDLLQLHTVYWILEKMMTVGVIAILIVFQPELRRGLEYLGRSRLFSKPFIEVKDEEINNITDEIVEAVASLSRQKIGALIVFERKSNLSEIVNTGTLIDGEVSSGLLINIFIPNTPLHDGAVVIKENMIKAAGCLLPLTDDMYISKELGTRHRAAIGITERTDSLAVIVSEETGVISIADNGKLTRYIDIKTLKEILLEVYKPESQKHTLLSKWRNKHEQSKE